MKEATTSYKSIKTLYPYIGIKCEDYWHIDYKSRDFTKEFDYYWDLVKKYEDYNGAYDKNKIPLYLGSDGKSYYSSIFLGHFAIGAYQKFLDTNNNDARKDFILIADWFVNNINVDGLWINKYPMKTFELNNDWHSGLSQAKGISTLVRAFYLTKDKKYLNAINLAIKPFLVKVSDGGIKIDVDNCVFFEEYTTKSPSLVLNGHIFAVWALRDVIELFKLQGLDYEELSDFYNKVVVDLSSSLHLWDTGRWSRYDLWEKHFNIASLFYHDLHIKQLNILYELTNIDEFKVYSKKWRKYRNNPIIRMLSLIEKIKFRLVKP